MSFTILGVSVTNVDETSDALVVRQGVVCTATSAVHGSVPPTQIPTSEEAVTLFKRLFGIRKTTRRVIEEEEDLPAAIPDAELSEDEEEESESDAASQDTEEKVESDDD